MWHRHHADPDLIMCHELLHVRTGLTDATHEAWICDVAAALVALKRRAACGERLR